MKKQKKSWNKFKTWKEILAKTVPDLKFAFAELSTKQIAKPYKKFWQRCKAITRPRLKRILYLPNKLVKPFVKLLKL